MKIDPAKIAEYSKEKLVKFYNEARDRQGVLEAIRKIVGGELLGRMETDGEVIGRYALTKAKRVTFPDISLEQAKELGAVKEVVDHSALKKIKDRGAKIKHKVVEYLVMREIEEK